ncbi:TonB-dependent receptor [Sphingomonas sp. KRR8]|uniref:TonB-dependent receptor n=1 Tax=Sphingomonas sp. KRR8 TaxID=2942996 RepID=UPI0020210E6C|nr:TonB-dependent receptor [Sphingomonas sp. KRR8]URD59922.1 TonB-dependent receptor [Sphingomonas sp. KRR8]
MTAKIRTALWVTTCLSSTALHAQQTTPPPPNADGPAVVTTNQPAPKADTDNAAEVIIVTAQRRSETLERAAVAVSVVSAQTLAEKAITTETDLQIAVPGLTVKSGQNENQLNFSLRGQSVDPFSSSRPSVLPYFNEIQVGGVGGTALYDLSSVQVLKGPQGTLFGRNSTGGAVLYTSAKPTKDFGGYVTGRIGNYNARQLEGAVNIPLATDVALLRVAGFIQRRRGYQLNLFNGQRLGEIKRENARVSLTLKPTSGFSNETVVDYGHSSGASLSSVVYSVNPLGAPSFIPFNFLFSPAVDSAFGAGSWAAYLQAHPRADPAGLLSFFGTQQARGPYIVNVDSPNFYRQKKLIASNITTVDLGAETKFKNVFGYVRSRFKGAGEFDGTPYGIDGNGPSGRGGLITQVSEEAQILGRLFDNRLDYVAGVYLTRETDDTRSESVIFDFAPISPPVVQINDGKFTNKTAAVYAQGTYTIVGNLKATAGARYTREATKFVRAVDDTYVTNPLPAYNFNQHDVFKRLSWTLGLEDQITPSTLVYAKARRSFRSGGFNYFAPPTVGFGNATGGEYRPETATDVELGLKYRGRLGAVPARFSLAAYNMKVKDIQRAFYAAIFGNLASITVNVPEAKIKGIEAEVSADLSRWLTVGGNINYTDAKFTKNTVDVVGNPQARFDTYPDTPKWSGAAFAAASIPVTGRLNGTLRGDVYTQSSTYFSSTGLSLTPGTKLPSYTLINLRAGIEDKVSGWSIAGIVKNLTKEVYYTGGVGFGNIFSLNTAVPGEPRTFLVEGRFRF